MDSPGCSQQLDLYQHELEEFTRRGVGVVGISVDSVYSHGAWAAVRGIGFPLLADFDPKGEVARKYCVYREELGFTNRALYVIDGEGVIGVSSWSPHGRQIAPPHIPVVVYGTRWCAATRIVRRHLERFEV